MNDLYSNFDSMDWQRQGEIMRIIEKTHYPQPPTVAIPGSVYPCITRGGVTSVTVPTTTYPINSTVTSVKTIDAFQLSAMMQKIEKRLNRIEEQLLLIFDQDGPA
jgi:hypothetical protein